MSRPFWHWWGGTLMALFLTQQSHCQVPPVEPSATLEQLLSDYRRFGLPLPPPNAPMVRFRIGVAGGEPSYYLGFLVEPVHGRQPAKFLDEFRIGECGHHFQLMASEPDGRILDDSQNHYPPLVLAIQCHARGWHRLAARLLDQTPKSPDHTIRQQLAHRAWTYWWERSVDRNSDRGKIIRRLHFLLGEDETLYSEEGWHKLLSLESAHAPSRAPPGSVEFLIDQLVDVYGYDGSISLDDPRVRQLAVRGFDAIPAMIDHLYDDRLTRAIGYRYRIRVRHVISAILETIAGGDLEPDSSIRGEEGGPANPAWYKRWWEKVRPMGEEKYLLARMASEAPSEGTVFGLPLAILGEKYPQHLPRLYGDVLERRSLMRTGEIAAAVRHSLLPAEQKVALLSRAARHQSPEHRPPALGQLLDLDRSLGVWLLVQTLDALPKDTPQAYWECPEADLARLVAVADDPRAWDALQKAAQRASIGLRMQLLGRAWPSGEGPPSRHHLTFLTHFLDDEEVRDLSSSTKFDRAAGSQYPRIAVRDFAALQLAAALGIDVEDKPDRTPDEWSQFRSRIRAAVRQELQPEKPPPDGGLPRPGPGR